jgi:AmiR/NasT family two-component response regulator
MFLDGARLGSLTVYADRAGAFDPADERVATLCVTHASLALTSVQRAQNLLTALGSRDTIGMAKGVLMERLRITSDAAFALLSERSQASGRKVVDVAARVVETGSVDV